MKIRLIEEKILGKPYFLPFKRYKMVLFDACPYNLFVGRQDGVVFPDPTKTYWTSSQISATIRENPQPIKFFKNFQ